MPSDLERVIAEALDSQTDGFDPDDLDEARNLVAVVREYLLSDEAVERAWGVFDAYTEDEMAMRAALAAALGAVDSRPADGGSAGDES
jgi:hypothetical protein